MTDPALAPAALLDALAADAQRRADEAVTRERALRAEQATLRARLREIDVEAGAQTIRADRLPAYRIRLSERRLDCPRCWIEEGEVALLTCRRDLLTCPRCDASFGGAETG
ncbi:hypothetical protein [Frigidibacter sp. MR17.24]|uniref:hypothetical protein n=1 Tax=Frigidibacter sp. MR17.24 TaxID=3127345 RepID=UPI003012C3E4